MPRVLGLPFVALVVACFAGNDAAQAFADEPVPRWIAALAPGVDARRIAAMDRAEPLAARLAAIGLRAVATLGDGIGRDGAGAAASPAPDADALPWAFDPARVVLLEPMDEAAWRDGGAVERAQAWLESDPAIEWVEPDRAREPCVWSVSSGSVAGAATDMDAFPNDPCYRDGRQWGLGTLGAPPGAGDVRAASAWARSVWSDSVVLAVCDTGVDPAHPELAGTLLDGTPRLFEGIDVTTPGASFADSVAHGTLVAGVMAARTNDGAHFDSLGIAGVCGGDGVTTAGCRLTPVKISTGSRRVTSSFAIARGVLHAAAAGARAINLSFAGGAPSRTERLAFLDALARGAVVVCAAGNAGLRDGAASVWPAAHAADGLCVQVGACDPRGERCVFSSHGRGLDVLAPGLDVWTTYMTYPSAAGGVAPGYLSASGTSFAAPFATGTIGLLAASRASLAPEDFQHVLRASARDAGAPGPDSLTGWGLLDASAALALVDSGAALWHAEARPEPAAVELDTLVVAERGLALLDSLGRRALAKRWTLRARIAIPDSFADSSRAWVRVSHSNTLRGDWRVAYLTPWADVRRAGARTIEIECALFRIVDARADRLVQPDDPARWIPVPPERARVAFTVLGTRRAAGGGEPVSHDGESSLRATPNPMRGALTVSGPPGVRVRIVDIAGRELARLALGAQDGRARWDGLGPGGRATPPGLYWVVGPHGRATRFVRLPRRPRRRRYLPRSRLSTVHKP